MNAVTHWPRRTADPHHLRYECDGCDFQPDRQSPVSDLDQVWAHALDPARVAGRLGRHRYHGDPASTELPPALAADGTTAGAYRPPLAEVASGRIGLAAVPPDRRPSAARYREPSRTLMRRTARVLLAALALAVLSGCATPPREIGDANYTTVVAVAP